MDRMTDEVMQDIIIETSRHERRGYMLSFMEAVAWRLGLAHGEYPEHEDGEDLICPVLAHHARFLSKILPDDYREAMREYIDPVAHSKNKEKEQARQRVFVLSAARVFAAMAAEYDGLDELAARLRAIPDDASYEQIQAEAEAVKKAAYEYRTGYVASRAAEVARCGDNYGFSPLYWVETIFYVLQHEDRNDDEILNAALETFEAAMNL